MARDRDYELGLVINPDVGEDQARAIVERVSQSIIGNDGPIVRVNAWGRRRLTYPIQHHRDGLYYFFDLIMPPTAVVEIERALRVNEDVIRHLMKARDPKTVAQQRQRDIENDRAAEEARARAAAAAEAHAAEAQATAEAQAAAGAQIPAEAPVTEERAPEESTTAEVVADVPTEATEPEATAVAPETDAS
jgi:small subunit ribosomal protein S6